MTAFYEQPRSLYVHVPDTCNGDAMSNHAQNLSSPTSSTPGASCRVTEAARTLGLKPVRAWVPDEQATRSAGAERVRRFREEAEQRGLKQLSITVPSDLHPALKALAKRTKSGEDATLVLAELMPGLLLEAMPPSASSYVPRILDGLPAWRRWLLRWLLPVEQRKMLN